MKAPNDFTFRSGWVLNTQFTFNVDEKLPIQAIYDMPTGERFYALRTGTAHLNIFVRPDGTLCNKVLNTRDGMNVFLAKEYASNPGTKLEPPRRHLITSEPQTLRVIYLGSSGGMATFRAIWSDQGAIIRSEDLNYDQTVSQILIGDIQIAVSNLKADSVTVDRIALTDPDKMEAEWNAIFRVPG